MCAGARFAAPRGGEGGEVSNFFFDIESPLEHGHGARGYGKLWGDGGGMGGRGVDEHMGIRWSKRGIRASFFNWAWALLDCFVTLMDWTRWTGDGHPLATVRPVTERH